MQNVSVSGVSPLSPSNAGTESNTDSQELATREHMLDHGQLGPPTPFVPSALSPPTSRRPSIHASGSGSGHVGIMAGLAMSSMSGEGERRPSMGVAGMSPACRR